MFDPKRDNERIEEQSKGTMMAGRLDKKCESKLGRCGVEIAGRRNLENGTLRDPAETPQTEYWLETLSRAIEKRAEETAKAGREETEALGLELTENNIIHRKRGHKRVSTPHKSTGVRRRSERADGGCVREDSSGRSGVYSRKVADGKRGRLGIGRVLHIT